MNEEASVPARSRGSIPDRVLGIAGGAMLVVALALLVAGGPVDDGTARAGSVPSQLVLISPTNGSTVDGAMELVFTAGGESLEARPTGWGTALLHVHAEIDGVERMPAMADIRRAGEQYTWTLTDPPAGEVEVRLLWSDARHRPVAEGASETVTVTIKPADRPN